MTDEEWQHDFARCLGLFLAGDALEEQDEKGRPILDQNFLLLINAHHEPISFAIPALGLLTRWRVLLDTGSPEGAPEEQFTWSAKAPYPLREHSLALLMESQGRGTDPHDNGT